MQLFLSILGFALSASALWIHIRSQQKKRFRAWCDLGRNASCTRVFGSRYGKILGIPNPVFGLVWYGSIPFLPETIFTPIAWGVLFLSLVLAYLLYVRLRDFCIVCTAIYLINVLLVVQAL
ncbi:MAG: hypothetical protein K9M51_03655 [Candidatus Gracilibacteria bacterium]|nr:hypothetical protein [Candidatus Gracilibacteria bacterium]